MTYSVSTLLDILQDEVVAGNGDLPIVVSGDYDMNVVLVVPPQDGDFPPAVRIIAEPEDDPDFVQMMENPARHYYGWDGSPREWPWDASWWKPSPDPIANLVKAGALIAAEIDRLQRKG